MYQEFNVLSGEFTRGFLINGSPFIVSMKGKPIPATISVEPVAGDTVAVKFSVDGGNTFHDWIHGAVTSSTDFSSRYAIFVAPLTHVSFQRTVGTGTTSAWSIC